MSVEHSSRSGIPGRPRQSVNDVYLLSRLDGDSTIQLQGTGCGRVISDRGKVRAVGRSILCLKLVACV